MPAFFPTAGTHGSRTATFGTGGVTGFFDTLSPGAEAAGPELDLPFHDVTSWIEYRESQGITGPGTGPAQRALAAELLDPVMKQFKGVRPACTIAPRGARRQP